MASRPANPALREGILATSIEIVETEGVGRLTMRAVAERVGYSPASIYLYFENKEDLLEAVVTALFERFAAHLLASETAVAPLDRYRQRQRAYVEWAIRNPGLYRLMFETLFDAERAARTPADVGERRMSGLGRAAGLLEEAGRQGAIRMEPGAADRLAQVSWAAVHGIASLTLSWRLFGIPGVMLSLDEAVSRALELTDAYLERTFGHDRPAG